MSKRDTWLLRAAALWTIFVWVTFVRNQISDDTQTVGFKVVHFGLAAVSIAFGLVIWRVAGRNRDAARAAAEEDVPAGS